MDKDVLRNQPVLNSSSCFLSLFMCVTEQTSSITSGALQGTGIKNSKWTIATEKRLSKCRISIEQLLNYV